MLNTCGQSLSSVSSPTSVIVDYTLTGVDKQLKPGDMGVLVIVIKNTGGLPAEEIEAYIPATKGLAAGERWTVGALSSGASLVLTTNIKADPDVYVGSHVIPLEISYKSHSYKTVYYSGVPSYEYQTEDLKTTWRIPVRVWGDANFLLTPGTTTFYDGIHDNLTLSMTPEKDARDISVTMSSNCTDIMGLSKVDVGDLDKGQSAGLSYAIKPKDVGICSVSLLLEYYDASGNSLSETKSIGVDVLRSDIDLKIESVIAATLSPGASGNVTIYVKNAGKAKAADASIMLNLSDPFIAETPEKYVGDIGGGGSIGVPMGIIINSNAQVKAYCIPVKIEYFDASGAKHTLEKIIGIEVDGKPRIKAVVSESDPFTTGTKGKVTVEVINNGFADVKFLEIKMLSGDGYNVLPAGEAYIGDLDSDDSETADFEVEAGRGEGTLPLNVEITYNEKNSDVKHTENFTLYLNVLSEQEYAEKVGGNGRLLSKILMLPLLIITIVMLWFVYRLVGVIISYLDRKLFRKK